MIKCNIYDPLPLPANLPFKIKVMTPRWTPMFIAICCEDESKFAHVQFTDRKLNIDGEMPVGWAVFFNKSHYLFEVGEEVNMCKKIEELFDGIKENKEEKC